MSLHDTVEGFKLGLRFRTMYEAERDPTRPDDELDLPAVARAMHALADEIDATDPFGSQGDD